ncbi:hypothetical protein [Reyranella sp.]|uniref:hypothetical protein n=1 Tax=Reyranella sp. TaxID=1929291 RepID=UPI003F71DDAD
MTDYDPRLDKPVYDDVVMTPKAPSRGLYLVVGVVAAIVAAAGLMFFSGNTADRNDMARSPDAAGIGAATNAPRTPEVPGITPIPATPTPEPVPAPGQQQ